MGLEEACRRVGRQLRARPFKHDPINKIMNNITLAHIGGELVVISGVAFYFHKKTTALQAEVDSLKRDNEQLIAAVKDLQQGLQQLGGAIGELQVSQRPTATRHAARRPETCAAEAPPRAVPSPQTMTPPARQRPAPRPSTSPLDAMMSALATEMPEPMQPQVVAHTVVTPEPPMKRASNKITRVSSESDDSGDETLDDKDLDKELAGELSKLGKAPAMKCDGDVCTLE